MYLYSMTAPGVKLSFTNHKWFEDVYEEAERAIALEVSHDPSAATEPQILMVSPTVVVTVSSKVIATVPVEVAVAEVEVVVAVFEVVVEDFVVVAVAVVEELEPVPLKKSDVRVDV